MLATIWVTTACNFRCKYCYEGQVKEKKFLTEEKADEVISYLFSKAKLDEEIRIVFHGGEPLLNFKVIKFIINEIEDKYKDFNVKYSMTTNGSFIDKEIISYIAEKFDEISFSLDGCKNSNDLNRIDINGDGTYDKVTDNLRCVLNVMDSIRFRMTVTANNVENLFENVLHLIVLGAKTIVPGINYEDENWNKEKMDILYNQLLLIKEHLKVLNDESIYVAMLSKDEIKRKIICDGGSDNFHIDPDGNIYPCIYTVGEEFFKIGDVKVGINNQLKKLRLINSKDVKSCSGCNYRDFCLSNRCKFINKKLTGDFYTASPVVCHSEQVKLRICSLIN